MNADSATAGSSNEVSGWLHWTAVVAALGVGLAAVSRQSLWIDEACTAGKAIQPSLAGWWQVMVAEKGGDLQMPLYMLYEWGFAKLFGGGEWALRAANIPWFVAGVAAFLTIFQGRQKLAATLAVLFSPFAWYYLDEARPYTMQLGASLILLAAACHLADRNNQQPGKERFWATAFCFGVVTLSGSSLFGMVWAGAASLSFALVVSWRRLTGLARAHLPALVFTAVIELAIGCYYLWSLSIGARGSAAGRTGLGNVAFIAYELLGFGGLGPGRNALRDGGVAALLPFFVPLALYSLAVLAVLMPGVAQLYRLGDRNSVAALFAVLGISLSVMLVAGHVVHFRVLARHCTPLLALILGVLAAGLGTCFSKRSWIWRVFGASFLALSLSSCLSSRIASRHGKDDYRGAATLARAALKDGRSVWWNASREGASYYQVSLSPESPSQDQALFLMNRRPEFLAGLPAPDLIISSKPDVFDSLDAVGAYIRSGRYAQASGYRAFSVWERRK